jgi:putative SOS response-associated peptidase YedK
VRYVDGALRSGAVTKPMCGRTALTATPDDLRDALALSEVPAFGPRYNVPPSRPVAVLRAGAGAAGRRLELLRWGLVPPWAERSRAQRKGGDGMALARSETILTTPAFRDAVRRRRCLIIVDGFFEWQRDGKRPSQPFFVRRADRAPFALAGVWARAVSADGEVVESCAIVTQAARPPADAVHGRMPLVLEPDAWERWLDTALTGEGAIASMLEPRAPALVAYPVSTYVNDPHHDDPRCIEYAEPAQLSL